jgi:hypothetical protein
MSKKLDICFTSNNSANAFSSFSSVNFILNKSAIFGRGLTTNHSNLHESRKKRRMLATKNARDAKKKRVLSADVADERRLLKEKR